VAVLQQKTVQLQIVSMNRFSSSGDAIQGRLCDIDKTLLYELRHLPEKNVSSRVPDVRAVHVPRPS